MMLIRPVEPGDLDALVELSRVADAGRSVLQSTLNSCFVLIQRSCQSFAGELELADRRYVTLRLKMARPASWPVISGIEAALGSARTLVQLPGRYHRACFEGTGNLFPTRHAVSVQRSHRLQRADVPVPASGLSVGRQ